MAALMNLVAKFARTSSSYCAPVIRQCRTVAGLTFAKQDNGTSLSTHSVLVTCTRQVSFVGKVTANDLWGGLYGVSNAGRKRGRGKGRRRKIDLNKGQVIGVGKSNMIWPGLNAPVVKGREVVGIKELPPNPDQETKIREIRDRVPTYSRFTKVPALQRGWTGAKMGGASIGPPDPVSDYTFEGFDTRVLELKLVTNMTGNLGRKQRFSAFVVTGNKRGLAGYGLAKAPNLKAALRKAKNMAAQRLHFIERYNSHTVFHNFYTKEKQTAIFVYKTAKGSGLTKCHRVIRTICEVIGIEDLSAKVEGSTKNVQNICKAFFKGLEKQETHQELADRVKLNIVEMQSQFDYVPVVVARPSDGKTKEEGIKEEAFNFENFYYNGKVPLVRKKPAPFYSKYRSWFIKKRFLMKMRNQKEAQLERLALNLEPSPEEKKLRAQPLQ